MRPIRGVQLFMAIALLTTAIAAVPPATIVRSASTGPIRGAVQWSLDEAHKQIVVDVKLQFFIEQGCSTTDKGYVCSDGPLPSQAVIDRVLNGIHRFWDGHRFKCWDIVIKIAASGIANPSQAADDAVDIALIDTPVHVTPYVIGQGRSGQYLGSDPSDRNTPARGNDELTAEWPTRSTAPDYVYAHEFGHILGLDDNYSEKDGSLLPGATGDLMWGQSPESHFVSEDMISRMVHRSGLPIDKIKCPMTVDGGGAHLDIFLATLDITRVHLYTCDYDPPTTDPKHPPAPMVWKGTIDFGGSYLTRFSGSGIPSAAGTTSTPTSFTATVPANGDGVLDVPFVPGETIAIHVQWGADGLLHAIDAAALHTGGVSLSTRYFFPGPPLFMTFKSGAPECAP